MTSGDDNDVAVIVVVVTRTIMLTMMAVMTLFSYLFVSR